MAPGATEQPWILYVDTDGEMRERVQKAFAQAEISTEAVSDVDTAQSVLADRRPHCIISEYDLQDETGLALRERVRATDDTCPFVLFTDSGSEQIASQAVTAGVSEYLTKHPVDEQLPKLVDRVMDLLASDPQDGISEKLKDHAMDRAPVGITIADMRLPDEPLIYVNDAFERLTGYNVEETVGRNCRFLQGDRTDEAAVATLRETIETDESTAVELRNYRKDGTEFWNRVEIAPIQSVDGKVTHYVGYQTDVSDRKDAEIAARERARALERKQQELEGVLARIEGVVHDVSVGVMQTKTAAAIQQEVCEALVRAEGYQLAWIGERAHEGDSVELQHETNADDQGQTDIETDSRLVETAVTDGSVTFDGSPPDRSGISTDRPGIETELSSTIKTNSAWLGIADDNSRAVVPVSYRDIIYGVVGVHTDDSNEFDRHDAVVLGTVGRIVGTALNAVRTQSLLQGEAATELAFSLSGNENFVELTAEVECDLAHVGTIPPGENSTLKLFFEVTDGSPEAVVTAATARVDIADATLVSESEDGNSGLVRLSIDESPMMNLLTEFGGTITNASASDGTGTVTVQLSKDANPRTFVDEFESRVPSATLVSYHDDERPERTNQEFVSEVNAALTDRQRDALQTAYASGFFSWPRKASGDDIAEVMDISRATFHQHLRTAERKLLDAFYDQ